MRLSNGANDGRHKLSGTVNVIKAGLVLGAVLGGWHLCWSALVAIDWAQPVIDFIFWIHFIRPVYVVEAFDFIRAFILILVTAGIGFAIGASFALMWNVMWKH